MTAWLAGTGAWLLLQTATLPDTIVTKQVAVERTWFDTVTSLASIAMTLALLALAVGLIPAAWNFRKSYKKLNDLLDKVYADVTPLVRHAHTVADNADYITTAIRVDIQQVSRTVNTANERLLEAARTSERRLAEFNALLRVMQEEAEDVFVATAATLRGVRTGAAAFGDELEDDLTRTTRVRLDDRLARLEALAAEAAGDLEHDDEVDEHGDEPDDGHDEFDGYDEQQHGGAVAPDGGTERPRIRPRRPRGGGRA